MGKAVVIVLSTAIPLAVAGVAGAVVLILQRRKRPVLNPPTASAGSLLRHSSLLWYQQQPVFVLKNGTGCTVELSPIGASITRLVIPDKKGKKADVVLSYDCPSELVTSETCPYFSVVVGRVANRIANAKFELNGEQHKLFANNGGNSLHGGALGLHKRKWDAREVEEEGVKAVEFSYTSPHGEEGYPGNVFFRVRYALAKDSNTLSCTIAATADEATPINVAQHSYFNLAGHDAGSVLDHVVRLNADHYTPVRDDSIPTGAIAPVAGTPFDFTTPHAIGERIAAVPGPAPGGYDHNYVLFGMGPQAKYICKNGMASDKPKLAASVSDPKSGRVMEVLTTAPGVQFYTGNYLDGTIVGKGGAKYAKHAGFCLETQGFPDAVNQPAFPSVVLQPQDMYCHEIVYRFSTTD